MTSISKISEVVFYIIHLKKWFLKAGAARTQTAQVWLENKAVLRDSNINSFKFTVRLMIYHTFSLLLLLCVGEALRISSARLAPVQDSSQFLADTQHNNESFTFGFIRTDTFDRLNYAWIRAQVLPIGVCFKEGIYGGSAEYAQATMGSSYLWKTAHFYNSSDCSGDFLTSVFQMPVVETLELVEHIVRVVPNIEAALALDSRFTSGGLVIS